eukprot:863094-Heterocapsa_arctica.AAC.1
MGRQLLRRLWWTHGKHAGRRADQGHHRENGHRRRMCSRPLDLAEGHRELRARARAAGRCNRIS